MGFLDTLQRFLGDPTQVAALATTEAVSALLPADATYATTGVIGVLPDVRQFKGGEPGEPIYGRDLGWLPHGQEPALLCRTPSDLLVATTTGVTWRRPVIDLEALDGHRKGGFLVFAYDGTGLAVSTQTPVHIPTGSQLRTVGRVTNLFSGWDTELSIPRYW